MLNVCLLTLTWMADPSAVNFDASNVVVPMSTCARPAVRVAEAQSSCATPSSLLSGVPPAPTDTRRRFVGQQAAFLKN